MNVKSTSHGFVHDAKKLVEEFKERNSTDFAVFANVWEKRKFSYIFLGRSKEKEMVEFTRQILRITLDLMCEPENTEEHKVGYLYLLYGLFRYQVLKPQIKVRVTLEHWPHIETLRDEAEAKKNKNILFVIRYLIRYGIDLVATPMMMGPMLANSAVSVDLTAEPEESVEDIKAEAAKMFEDVETCFRDLKVMKKDYEESMKTCTSKTPCSNEQNIPYQAFLDCIEDNLPSTSENSAFSDIGYRRAHLKAAAYNKVICKVTGDVKRESGRRKLKAKVGRPRKHLLEEPTTEGQDSEPVAEPVTPKPLAISSSRRGQKQERLFKKKYRFLEGIEESKKKKRDTFC